MYIKITSDEYELPIDFDVDPHELAERNGIKYCALMKAVSRSNHGEKTQYIRVEIEDG